MRVVIAYVKGEIRASVAPDHLFVGRPADAVADCEPDEVVAQIFTDAESKSMAKVLSSVCKVSPEFELALADFFTKVVIMAGSPDTFAKLHPEYEVRRRQF